MHHRSFDMQLLCRLTLLGTVALTGLTACNGVTQMDLETDQIPADAWSDLPPVCIQAPVDAPARLLTRNEYNNTVRDLLGDATRPADRFPPEPRVLGFENNSDAHRVNSLLVSRYLEAAESVSARALAERRAQLIPCDPATIGEEACGDQFLGQFATRAFRRPLTDEERTSLTSFFSGTLAKEGFGAAVEWTIQVVLQSPQFLYRVERAEHGDPHELASRLSYFLWSSMPDDALLEAARTGELATEAGLEQQARRMLKDPKAIDTVQSFFRQWLHLDGMEKLEKNTTAHPEFVDGVAPAWRRGLELFIEDSVWNGEGTLEALFTSPALFVDEHTAPIYGMELPTGTGPFARMEMSVTERRGLLTQPGLLAALAGPYDSSPVQRGVFVRERFLCEALPAPPANISIVPPDPDPNSTTRERFSQHTADPTCAGCHQLIDPVGFGFEQYDALGRFRAAENGKPIDASGEVTGVRDPALAGPFNGAAELSERFARSPLVRDCVATQWYRYAAGRLEATEDGCSLRDVKLHFARSGGDFRELLVAIIQTPAFRTRGLPDATIEVTP